VSALSPYTSHTATRSHLCSFALAANVFSRPKMQRYFLKFNLQSNKTSQQTAVHHNRRQHPTKATFFCAGIQGFAVP
jgi:hypothetical protein